MKIYETLWLVVILSWYGRVCAAPPVLDKGVEVSFSLVVHQTVVPSLIVPATKVGGLLLIKGVCNGRVGNYILDTGANGLVLNSRYFDGGNSRSIRRAKGLGGDLPLVGEIVTDSFAVEEWDFGQQSAQIIDLRQIEKTKRTRIDGLVGYALLKDYEVYINTRDAFITLSQLDRFGELLAPLPYLMEKVDSFQFVMANHLPVLEVSIEDRRKRLGLDTGAEYNLLNVRANKIVLEKNFSPIRRMEVGGVNARGVDGLAGNLYRVTLKDRYRCGGMKTVVLNLSELEKIYDTKLDGILGAPFFAPWILSINYRKQLLYIHRFKPISP